MNRTLLAEMPRIWSASAATLSPWSTLIADSAARRNRSSLTGLASVPELIASVSIEDSRRCWSWIRARSEVANEWRSRAYSSAVIPFTWCTPSDRCSPL